MEEKIKLVMVGHVDHGKSTLIGRLLFNTQHSVQQQFEQMQKAQSTFDLAFLTDHFKEEREQKITIDTAQIPFRSKRREYIIIDAPGHVEFILNMMTGASQADAAVLIIDAGEGVQEQTKRHAVILSLLGIKQLLVVVNKIDLVGYDEPLFQEVVKSVEQFLEKLEIEASSYIPISALNGDNVTQLSEKTPWYCGPTLMDALDSIEYDGGHDENWAAFAVQDVDVHNVNNKIKRLAVGHLEVGTLHTANEVCLLPAGRESKIESLTFFEKNRESAVAGECFGIQLKDAMFFERGTLICTKNHRIHKGIHLECTVIAFSDDPVYVGEPLSLRCSTQEVNAVITAVFSKMDSSTLQELEGPNQLNTLEIGKVALKTKEPLSCSLIDEVPAFSRFVLMKGERMVIGGIITKILTEDRAL